MKTVNRSKNLTDFIMKVPELSALLKPLFTLEAS